MPVSWEDFEPVEAEDKWKDFEPVKEVNYQPTDIASVAAEQGRSAMEHAEFPFSGVKGTAEASLSPDAAAQYHRYRASAGATPLPVPGIPGQIAGAIGGTLAQLGRAGRDIAGAYAFEAAGEPVLQAQQLGIHVPSQFQPEPQSDTGETPIEQGMAQLPAGLQMASKAAYGTIEAAPRLAGVVAGQAMGIPAPIGAAAMFGATEEGFDPKQAVIAAALPFVGRFSGEIGGAIAKKFGATSIDAINLSKGVAGLAGPALALIAEGEQQIAQLPASQRKQARIDLYANVLGQSLLGPMGVKYERAGFREAVGKSATEQSAGQKRMAELDAKQKALGSLSEGEIDELAKLHGSLRLTDEESSYIDAERKGMDVPVNVVEGVPIVDENTPFSTRREMGKHRVAGQFMRANKAAQTIDIFPEEFKGWWNDDLAHLTVEEKQSALKGRLAHERIHLATTDEMSSAYYKNLSSYERSIFERTYFGKQGRPSSYSDKMVGDEAIRMRIEQLSGMTPGEIREAVGREQWTLKGLSVLSTAVRAIRSRTTAGGRANRAIDNQVLDNLEHKIEFAKQVAAGKSPADDKESPASIRVNQEDIDLFVKHHGEIVGEFDSEVDAMNAAIGRQGGIAPETDRPASDANQNQRRVFYNEDTDKYVVVGTTTSVTDAGKEQSFPASLRKKVTIERADGSQYEAEFNGYYDLTAMGRGAVPSIGRPTERGLSHGMLDKDEKIVTPVPSFEEWQGAESPASLRRRETGSQQYRKRMEDMEKLQKLKEAAAKGEEPPKIQGVGGAPAKVPFEERAMSPSYVYPETTPKAVSELAAQHIASDSPDFDTFVDSFKTKFGKEPERGAMLEAWGDAVSQLVDAPGEHLKKLVNELRLRPQVIGPERAGATKALDIPDAQFAGSVAAERKVVESKRRAATMNRSADQMDAKAANIEESLSGYHREGEGQMTLKGNEPEEVIQRQQEAAKLRGKSEMLRRSALMLERGASLAKKPTFQGSPGEQGDLFGERLKPSKTLLGGDEPLEEGRETARTGPQRLRNRAVAAVMQKLWDDATGSVKDLKRPTVTPEEIRWSKGQEAYEAAPDDLDESDLGRFMTRGAGMDRTTTRVLEGGIKVKRKALPESATKRLVVLQDRDSGDVHVVSAYRNNGKPVMLDPSDPGGAHRPFEDVARRYRPLYSILLDEPVSGFKKSYKSLEEYNQKFGNHAQELLKEYGHGEYSVAPSEVDIEGSIGLRGRPEYQPRGVLETKADLQPEEARAIYDAFSAMERPRDAHDYFTELANRAAKTEETRGLQPRIEELAARQERLSEQERVEVGDKKAKLQKSLAAIEKELRSLRYKSQGGMTARDRVAVSGLVKVYDALGKEPEYKDFTPEQLRKELLEEIYATTKRHETQQSFVEGAARRFRQEPALPAEPAARESQTSREIIAKRGPATIRGVGRGLKEIFARTKLGTEIGVEREYRKRARDIAESEGAKPAEPTAGDKYRAQGQRLAEEGYAEAKRELESENPASIRRVKESAEEESAALAGRVGATITRAKTDDALAASRDDADTNAHIFADATKRAIELESANKKNKAGDPAKLAAANAIIQTGALKPKYSMDAEAQAELGNRITNHKDFETIMKAFKAEGPQSAKKWQAEINTIEGEAINDMLREGLIDHTGVKYEFDEDAIKNLKGLMARVDRGIAKAQANAKSRKWLERRLGKAWEKSAYALKAELEYAQANWENPELRATAEKMKRELGEQYDREIKAGYDMQHDEDYVPGRYDAEFFNDNTLRFGAVRLLGLKMRAPKTFENGGYYEAIEDGPYLPATRDGSAIVGHRVRQGMRAINRKMWQEGLKNIPDPESGKPIAIDAVPKKGKDPGMRSPDPEYIHQPEYGNIAVRAGFEGIYNQLTSPSFIAKDKWAPTAFALQWGQMLKHTILIGDLFHLGKVSQFALSIMGRKAGWRGGLTALEFRTEDMQRAVDRGVIRQQDADWANAKVNVRLGKNTVPMSRLDIVKEFRSSGLNVGRIQDAIYKDLVANIPFIGRYNKFLFDKLTRGLMLQSAMHEFERMNAANPEIGLQDLTRDIARDINNYYGSIGRQGIFKSATMQDLARMGFLAPQWVEGLVRKEAGFAKRLVMAPARALGYEGVGSRKGLTALGTTGRGVGRGLAAMVVLTQVINLMTRRKPTWQNEEEGHKFDAWIPDATGKTPGFWFSPLAVFNELTHDVVRLGHTKPTVVDTLAQIGENKLHPAVEAAIILATGNKPTGEHTTSTARRLAATVGQLAPVPISFGRVGQLAASKVAPGLVSPPEPGAVQRQLIGSGGFKIEPAAGPSLQMADMARQFIEKNGLQKSTGWMQVQTDEPGYTKLRMALRNGDSRGAAHMFQALLQTHTEQEVNKAMKQWSKRPFTGSKKNEREFQASLTKPEFALYGRALDEKYHLYEKYVDFVIHHHP